MVVELMTGLSGHHQTPGGWHAAGCVDVRFKRFGSVRFEGSGGIAREVAEGEVAGTRGCAAA